MAETIRITQIIYRSTLSAKLDEGRHLVLHMEFVRYQYLSMPQMQRIQIISNKKKPMQQPQKPTKPPSTIAAKNTKYFSQSQSAHQVPSNSSYIDNINNTNYQSQHSQNSQPRQRSPKPDYKIHAHIGRTNFPDVSQDKIVNRNKIVYRTIRENQRKEGQFGEINKSKERSTNNKNMSQVRKNSTFIKVQQGDTTDDNIDINPITQQFSTTLTTHKHKPHDETEQQLTQLKKYFQTTSKTPINTLMTPPIKLREMPRQNIRNIREYQSNKIQSSKSRQRQEFVSNSKYNSKQLKYDIIAKTLEQTIDENIQLKMENQQIKEMYKQALKTVSYLQQIIQDNYANSLKSKNVKYNKVEMKEVYSNLYPHENLNKIIKPSLQAQIKLYREREEEYRGSLRKNIRELEDQLEKVKVRQEEYKSIYEFFKKENSSLHEELRKLRYEKVSKYQQQNSQIPSEHTKQRKKSQSLNQSQQKRSQYPTGTRAMGKQDLQQLNETQKKKIGLLSPRIQEKNIKKEEVSALLDKFQRQVVFPRLNEANQRVYLMDQRCKELEKAIQNLLYERRQKIEKQKQADVKTKSYLRMDNSHATQGSQILEESRLNTKSFQQKIGGKAIGKLVKFNEQKPVQSSIVNNSIIQETKQKLKQKQDKIEEQIKKITQLQVKMVLNQQQFRSKFKQVEVNQIKKGQIIEKQLKKLKQKLENCNMQNFKYLYRQFTEILEQKKHLSLQLADLKDFYEHKHPKVWQLQKELNQTKKKKKELVQRCIQLQNYIHKNINGGKSTESFVVEGIYDNYFKENDINQDKKCLCSFDRNPVPYDEDQGRCALDWILHVEKAMEESIQAINGILYLLLDKQIFSI